ncbi:class I SAM-dependent methyltransferase [Arenibacter sp. M-2]|uniref:class I SAM-dependent methyltransferase n=1 Tax=Arenibacter sp. M-2 TaxID=3053612 RepID=UPI00256FE2EB|nr:class I SAM-dependent methyltransferase [Arenibacter sp. M-2]MDL5512606.1 class I SAM-dependent methyltransferase [Arenibacter sp. M-2]
MIPCPICNHPKTKLKYQLKFNVHECPNCGFQFCPEATFNKSLVSDLNEETREKALINLRKGNFQHIIASIKKNKDIKSKGLEVGPGYGWFLEVCRDHGIDCLGIEPETRFNEQYLKKGLEVQNGFFLQDLQKESHFDFIAYNDVMEHLPDLKGIMAANYALLNPQGLLIVNLPQQDGLIYFISKIAYLFGVKSLLDRMWQFNFHSPHLSYFTRKTLLKLAQDNNFDAVESFPLKTINLSEISDRIEQDDQQGTFAKMATKIGVFLMFPLLQIFPDTRCFIFRKK